MDELKDLINDSPIVQNTNHSSGNTPIKRPPIDAVDRIAESLVTEYSNPAYRKWYCKVIWDYGIVQIEEWRSRARDGKYPGLLFTYYVNQAKTYHSFYRTAQE